MKRLAAAMRAWLVEQLADWETPPHEHEVAGALDRIARRMLIDHAGDAPLQLSAA
jgi:hypothetical protein